MTSSLEIKNAKTEDNGTYICRSTSNVEGNLITSMKVHVLSGKYVFSNSSKNIKLIRDISKSVWMHLKEPKLISAPLLVQSQC